MRIIADLPFSRFSAFRSINSHNEDKLRSIIFTQTDIRGAKENCLDNVQIWHETGDPSPEINSANPSLFRFPGKSLDTLSAYHTRVCIATVPNPDLLRI